MQKFNLFQRGLLLMTDNFGQIKMKRDVDAQKLARLQQILRQFIDLMNERDDYLYVYAMNCTFKFLR